MQLFPPKQSIKVLLSISLSAILTALSFHPIGLHFLAWVGLVPVLFAVEQATALRTFLRGLIFGSLFALFSLFWIVFLQIPLTVKIFMVFGLILLFLYHGIFFGAGFVIAKYTGLWFLPLVLCGLEFIRGLGEIGFPWLTLGYSQANYPVVIQQASVYGIYGLSSWVVLVNVAIYRLLKNRKMVNLVVMVAVIVLPLIFGLARMRQTVSGRSVIVGVTQPNVDPNLKFTRAMREETFDYLIELSNDCTRQAQEEYGAPCDLVIWPESATPVFLKAANIYQRRVFEFVDKTGAAVFSGTAIYDFELKEIYNGAVLLEPGNVLAQEYKKLHLVPFGEHIPFDRYVPMFRRIDLGEGDYVSGYDHTVFRLKGFTFSCLICFEAIFPELAREFVNRGARFLVNITNDGWFGRLSGPQQHKNMAILRAVENGVPLVRCANTGISMVVDRHGRLFQETGLFVGDNFVHRITVDDERTPYSAIGDIVPVLGLLISTLVLLVRMRIRRQP